MALALATNVFVGSSQRWRPVFISGALTAAVACEVRSINEKTLTSLFHALSSFVIVSGSYFSVIYQNAKYARSDP